MDYLNFMMRNLTSSSYYSKATVKGFRAMAKVWIFRKTNDGDIVQRLTTVKDYNT